MSFLGGHDLRALNLPEPHGLRPVGLALGKGPNALEVCVADTSRPPTTTTLRAVWKARLGRRATPLLLVVLHDGKAGLCGPAGDQPPAFRGLDADRVETLCAAALAEPDRHAARRLLLSVIPDIENRLFALRNQGLFASHALKRGVPKRSDWKDAGKKAAGLLSLRGQELIRKLGFTIERLAGPAYVLRAAQTKVAVAVLLDRGESPDAPSKRFSGRSAGSYALRIAEEEHLDYVLINAGSTLRLYPVRIDAGVGRRGATETFTEVYLDLLPLADAGYLWLLFSADALKSDGSVNQILEESTRYAVRLGDRLRERIYDEVVPQLAQSLIAARHLRAPSARDLAETYEMALLILFRILFVAYAEDKDLLPLRTNSSYKSRSLTEKTNELVALRKANGTFGDESNHWDEVVALWHTVDRGNSEWGVPAYDGGLFSRAPSVSPLGAALESVTLPNSMFGPILSSLLVDNTPEGPGPVDFRSLSVREFGTIYEGLLESELSLAEADLTLAGDGKGRRYRPARAKDEVTVRSGRAYLHDTSGARKATGSFFTKHFAVEHLLDHALEPALHDHLERLDAMDDRRAAEAFFDFRVADIAMGSGHFLISAIDHIERALSGYRSKRPLPEVMHELARLRSEARKALRSLSEGFEIADDQLLRRLIARRCIYGVDLNPMAVDLARLSVWIHTFVPGLPLSFLDRNLVVGNSLVGIASFEEANDLLKEVLNSPLFALRAETLLGKARKALTRMARLSDANPAEIEQARAGDREVHMQVSEAAAVFDTLAAARIDTEVRNEVGSRWVNGPAGVRGSKEHRLALSALKAIPPFHFPTAFPEVFLRDRPGFDVIIGNPPWEEATVEEDRFWTRYNPGFHSLRQREQEVEKRRLRKERPDLVRAYEKELDQAELMRRLLTSGPFPGMGTGDPDVYKAFCWRFWKLVRGDGGRIGVVLPRSAFAARGSQEFRKRAFADGSVLDLTFMLNRGGWVFDDAEHRYTISLFALEKRPPGSHSILPLRGPFADEGRYRSGMDKPALRLPVEGVLSWTDTAALPLLPSQESGEVFLQLRKAPRLDLNDGKSWRARPHRELDATNDKKLMRIVNEQPEGFWPVFKGESFDIWNPDTGRYYAWADPDKVKAAIQKKRLRGAKLARSAFSEFPIAWNRDPATLPCCKARIAFRDVARATDTRTVIAALLPANIFLTNKGPFFLWPRGDECDQAFLLGVLCSIPLDWYARRFVEISLNYHVLNPFPIPRPDRNEVLWKRVVALAGRLASPDARFKKWAAAVGVKCGKLDDEEKDEMIHELDAVVAHLYGLSEKQLRHIFETFHVGWDYTERLKPTLKHFAVWRHRR